MTYQEALEYCLGGDKKEVEYQEYAMQALNITGWKSCICQNHIAGYNDRVIVFFYRYGEDEPITDEIKQIVGWKRVK